MFTSIPTCPKSKRGIKVNLLQNIKHVFNCFCIKTFQTEEFLFDAQKASVVAKAFLLRLQLLAKINAEINCSTCNETKPPTASKPPSK